MTFLDEIGTKLVQLEKKSKVAAKKPEFTLIEAKIVKFCTEPRVSSSIIELFPARPHNVLGIVQSLVKRGILLSCTNKYVTNLEHRDFNVVMTMTANKKAADEYKEDLRMKFNPYYNAQDYIVYKLPFKGNTIEDVLSIKDKDVQELIHNTLHAFDYVETSDGNVFSVGEIWEHTDEPERSRFRWDIPKKADISSDIATTWENADDLQREDLLKAVNITSDYIRQYSAIDSFDLLPIWLQNALRYEKKASVLPQDETLWKNDIKDTIANLKAENITFSDSQEMVDYLVGDKGDLSTEQKEYASQIYNESANVVAEKKTAGEIESDELFLYIENDRQLYERFFIPIIKNLTKKKKNNTYDSELAVKAFAYLAEEGAKKYAKDFGGIWSTMFDVSTRKQVATDFRDKFESLYANKEYDFMDDKTKQANGNIDESDVNITKTREGFLYEYRTPNDIVLKQHYIGYDDEEGAADFEGMLSDFLEYIKEQEESSGEVWEQTASKQASAYTDFVGKYMKENEGSSIGDAAKAWSKQKGKSEDKTDDKSKDKTKEPKKDIKEDKSTKTKKDVVKEDKEKVEKKADHEEEEFEEEFNEPSPQDYVMYDSRKGMSVGQVEGKFLGEFDDEDSAMIAIKEDMELNKFWPNVWYQDDHGGISLRTASKKQANFPIEGYENYNGFYIDTNTYKVYDIDGTSPYFADSIKDAKDWIDKEGVKTAAGEADGDYDTEFFDEIVNQLSAAGFSATYREFDKYQGVYLNVRGVDTFWVDEVYSRGTKSKEDVVKPYIKAVLIDADGNTYSATRGDYFQLKDDYIFEDYTLALTKQNGEKVEIENPKKSDLPDLVEVGSTFTYEKGTMTEVYIFTPENDPEVGIEVTNKDGVVDASDLVDYCKSVSGVEASIKKADSGYDFSVVNTEGFEDSVINVLSPFGQVNYEEEGAEEGGSVLEIGVLGVPADKLIEFAKTVESLGASIWSVAIGTWGTWAENLDDLTPTEFVTQILGAKEASVKKQAVETLFTDTYRIPSYALSYLVNADASGLEDEEIAMIDKFMQKFYDKASKEGGHVIVAPKYEPFFTTEPAFGLAGDVYETVITILGTKEASIKKADDEKTITEVINVPRKISPLEKTKDIPREEYIVAKEANDTLKDLYKSVMELSSQIATDEEEIKRVAAEMKKTKEIDPSKALLQESIEKLTKMLVESDKIVTINAEKVLKLVEKSSEEPVLSETVLAKLEEMREKHRQIEEDYIKSAGAQMKEIKRTITQELKVIPLRANKVAISFKDIFNKIKNFFTGWISDAKDFGKELDAITW